MEPDDLLCSRNARPQKALVGRAQWKINQPPSLEERTSDLGKISGAARPSFLLAEAARSECAPSMRAGKDSLAIPPKGKVGERKAMPAVCTGKPH